jgi:hypothetical protein
LLLGCGAATKTPKVADDSYDWSGYQGTFAPGGAGLRNEPAAAARAKPSEKAEKQAKGETSDKTERAEKADEAPAKKTSKGKIHGESVSSVSADVVAGASKTALKSKVLSTNVVVGQEYEQLQVVLKGVAVQIVRPAANPDKEGPKIRSPKVRSDDLAKTESAWYDPEADVLVLVQSSKKATSQRALKAILKR